MLARRDVLRLIASLSASATLPPALTPEQAAAALAAPVPFDLTPAPPAGPLSFGVLLPSASDFADGMAHTLWDSLDWGAFAEGAPAEWVAVEKLLAAVADDAPESAALRDLSVAVTALAIASWHAGARVGAELEGVRRAMLRPVMLCARCMGTGRQVSGDPAPCASCAGAGLVPAPAV
ncbi:MAG: hypothetical protein QM692_08080 [Thermomicrobiales bacterium]